EWSGRLKPWSTNPPPRRLLVFLSAPKTSIATKSTPTVKTGPPANNIGEVDAQGCVGTGALTCPRRAHRGSRGARFWPDGMESSAVARGSAVADATMAQIARGETGWRSSLSLLLRFTS